MHNHLGFLDISGSAAMTVDRIIFLFNNKE